MEVFILHRDRDQCKFPLGSLLIYWYLCLSRCWAVWMKFKGPFTPSESEKEQGINDDIQEMFRFAPAFALCEWTLTDCTCSPDCASCIWDLILIVQLFMFSRPCGVHDWSIVTLKLFFIDTAVQMIWLSWNRNFTVGEMTRRHFSRMPTARLCDSNDKCKQVGGVPVQLGQALYGGGGRVSVYGDVHYIMGTDRQTWLKTLPWWAVIKVELESGFLGWLTPVSVGARVTSISSDRKRRDATRRVRDCLHWEKANISLWSLHLLSVRFRLHVSSALPFFLLFWNGFNATMLFGRNDKRSKVPLTKTAHV